MYSVRWRPATSSRLILSGSAKPSYTGTMCVTPSPESTTTPVSSPCAYSVSTAWIEQCTPWKLKVSNMHSTSFSRFFFGFIAASVSMILCSDGSIFSRSSKV